MDRALRTNLFPSFIFGFAFAVLVSSFLFISPLLSLLVTVIGISIFVAEKIWNNQLGKEVLLLLTLLISFGLGALRYSIKDFHEPVAPIETGIVVSEPEERENSKRFVYLSDNGEKVLVNAPLYSPVQYGDKIMTTGKLEKPKIIENEGSGRDFDYGKYLSKDDIYWMLSFAEVEIISSGHGNPVRFALLKIKRSFVAKIKEILAEPHAGLLSGLIVSGKEALPKDILEEFRRAGVIHIVVLSGFNITLIAAFMRKLFQKLFIFAKLPAIPQAAAGASIVGIILFVIMTGAEATVVRAGIMAMTVVVAKFFSRKYSASRALVFAGFLMLIENPKILVFDSSFQLSFLATLGLIYFMNPIEKCLSRGVLTKWEKTRENLAQTLATQLTVLPLLIYLMGDVSLVAIPANLLILTAIPYTMLVGFLATLTAFIGGILAWPMTLASHILLSWILFVSHALGNLSFASIAIPSVSIWLIVIIYLLLIAFTKFSSTFPQFKFAKKSSM